MCPDLQVRDAVERAGHTEAELVVGQELRVRQDPAHWLDPDPAGLQDLGFGVWGLGFEVEDLGFGVWGLGFETRVCKVALYT